MYVLAWFPLVCQQLDLVPDLKVHARNYFPNFKQENSINYLKLEMHTVIRVGGHFETSFTLEQNIPDSWKYPGS